MSRIYISHTRGDQDFATLLADRLKQAGYEILSPSAEPVLGAPISEKIDACIQQQSDIVILLFSEHSSSNMASHHELGYAIGTGSAILPVRVHDVDLPENLARTVFIDAVGRSDDEILSQVQETVALILAQRSKSRAKRAEIQARVENSAETYIRNSLTELTEHERRYRHTSYILYAVSFATVIFAVASLGLRLHTDSAHSLDWQRLIQQTFSLTLFLAFAFIVVTAKFTFTLAKSFMVESLRNADRIHAIKFGEFYLKAFGEQAEWAQVKEAFQHWNIDMGSDFIRQDVKQIDPEIHQKFIELIKSINKP